MNDIERARMKRAEKAGGVYVVVDEYADFSPAELAAIEMAMDQVVTDMAAKWSRARFGPPVTEVVVSAHVAAWELKP